MLTSVKITAAIEQVIGTVLLAHGFHNHRSRKYVGWHEHAIWCIEFRALGGIAYRFSYPGISLLIDAGIFYDFIAENHTIPVYKGKIFPDDVDAHLRLGIDFQNARIDYPSIDFLQFVHKNIFHTLLYERWRFKRAWADFQAHNVPQPGIWWLEPDGSNIDYVLGDMKQQILHHVIPWFQTYTDIITAYNYIKETKNESYEKYRLLVFFAKNLKDEKSFPIYKQRFIGYAKEINHPINKYRKQLDEGI